VRPGSSLTISTRCGARVVTVVLGTATGLCACALFCCSRSRQRAAPELQAPAKNRSYGNGTDSHNADPFEKRNEKTTSGHRRPASPAMQYMRKTSVARQATAAINRHYYFAARHMQRVVNQYHSRDSTQKTNHRLSRCFRTPLDHRKSNNATMPLRFLVTIVLSCGQNVRGMSSARR
jgi:hypothetical protein